jgi:hypothetical protein
MKEDIIKKLKEVEEQLQQGTPLRQEDLVFLFGLSLIKDKKDE